MCLIEFEEKSQVKKMDLTSEFQPEVIVVGSGVLGSAMAAVLARDGRKVTVIERDLKEPDRIIGELLQPGGRIALNKLGLEACTEGIDAHVIKGYVIHDVRRKAKVEIPYPTESDKITSGKAFHHGQFVVALREAAKAEPNVRYIEGTVTKLLEENGEVIGVRYQTNQLEEYNDLYAPLTVVADGCFSKFRKHLVKEKPFVKSHFIGMIMHNCPQSKANHAELVLTDPNPILVYQISSTCTRVLVDVQGGLPSDIKQFLSEKIYPDMPEHLQEPFMDSIQNGRARSMPNSFLPPSPLEKPGVVCLGDAFNMRHPLTGGGMSVAFNDVLIFRDLLQDVENLSDHSKVKQACRELYAKRRNNHSFVVNVLSMALYELFSADEAHLKCLKNACFEYFKLGGECVSGPVGLLSILSPKPHILLSHFFAVALYAVYHNLRSEPWWAVHRWVYKSSGVFYKACSVIFPLIWSEVKTVVRF